VSDSVSPHGARTEGSRASRAPADQGREQGAGSREGISLTHPIHPPSRELTREAREQTAAASPVDSATMDGWRVGRHYPIHVYEGDRPVATFHTAIDARRAVAALAALAAVERVIEQAHSISPSQSMTVYVADLERALGRVSSRPHKLGQTDV